MASGQTEENNLSDDRLTGWSDIRLRISRHLTPQSALFRHAIRMSVVLCVGYAFIQLTGMQHGYWILLTSLFVCQPNYNATRRRLALRIIGTLAGILVGLPILYFVPSLEGQLILIVISGVLFFAFRTVQYAHATMFITLLVLLCFNLLGEGFEVAAPRVYDTLLGCAIAWAAVSFIWPDWKFRQLPAMVRKTLNADCRYLDAILVQYHQGKDNSLPYRIARRDAHNSDAELASVISNMSADPKADKTIQEAAFRLLCLNHTLLSYIPPWVPTVSAWKVPPCWTCSTMRFAMLMVHYTTTLMIVSVSRRHWKPSPSVLLHWFRSRKAKNSWCCSKLAWCSNCYQS